MSKQSREFPHIYLPENGKSENYTRPGQGGGSNPPPERDRGSHARYLEEAIGRADQQGQRLPWGFDGGLPGAQSCGGDTF